MDIGKPNKTLKLDDLFELRSRLKSKSKNKSEILREIIQHGYSFHEVEGVLKMVVSHEYAKKLSILSYPLWKRVLYYSGILNIEKSREFKKFKPQEIS